MKNGVGGAGRGRARVLYLDADWKYCRMMTAWLELSGYEVRAASTAAEGLRLARERCYDLILINLVPQGEAGVGVCRAIRAFDRRTPIVIYLENGNDDIRRLIVGAGAQGWLTRPSGEVLGRCLQWLRARA